ncbi:hypothetical protein [Bradyrhizobium sp. RT10b]|uniref:hypothetical protein n=1 Tax=Bradyrhizobium sp. RT10b TaxID=3156331 RepID=UPI003393C4FE
MDEVIALETEIQNALIAGTVSAATLPWAHDVLCNSQPPGTRLDRLRTVAQAITQEATCQQST